MKSIVYVHYQKFERDGSFVHTRMFSQAFGQLCAQQGIAFNVIAPAVVDHEAPLQVTRVQRLKTFLATFFISDIKALLVQWRRMQVERQQLQALQADMVLTRYNWNTLSVIWAARSLGIPVVLEINSPDEEDRGQTFYRLPGMAYFFSIRRALRLANGAFAVSEALARRFRLEAAGRPVHSIPNGVDIEKFDPALDGRSLRQQLQIDDAKIVIGFVGSFAPWHGLDLLFDAFATLVQEGLPVHLLLVGQPRHDSGPWLEQAEAPAIKPHITFAGHVETERVNQYVAAMDITVLPNSAWYCSPLKVFEYMAMAKAVVAVATEPVQEMLEDGRDGLLFAQGSLPGLTQTLRQVVLSSAERSRLGVGARARVASDYTWADNARRVFDLLSEVAGNTDTGKGAK